MDRRLFALDHNFPEPVLAVFAEFLPFVELVPIRSIDPAWTDLDDWELLVALHRHEREWDGLITNDENMLSLAKEMTVLSQTRLTLVVVKGEGHNPIRAVGSLLCHVRHICHHTVRDRAQVWNLRVAQKNHDEVGVYLTKIAERNKTSIAELQAANRLPAGRRSLLDDAGDERHPGCRGHHAGRLWVRVADTDAPASEWSDRTRDMMIGKSGSSLLYRMLWWVCVPLLPILKVQGNGLRKRVPRLPEAAGPFQGEVGERSGLPVDITVLGESSVAGVGVQTQEEGLAMGIARALADATGRPVRWQAVGMNGATMAKTQRDLVGRVQMRPNGLVVVALGINDAVRITRQRRWVATTALMTMLVADCSSSTLPPAATVVASHSARQSVLPSGLTVFVEDDSTLPVAGVVWTVRCGAARDPVGREGLAHAVEHLLFRAPATAGLTRYDSLQRLGAADLNGETSFDQTRYHAFVPQVAASELLAIWAAAMADPLAGVDEATFALEMGVVREELSYHDLPGEQERAREALARVVFPARHPYARPIGGTAASLAGIRLADARAFAAACYQPRNMTLVLAGPTPPSAYDSVLETLPASLRGDPAHPVAPSVPPAPGGGAYPSPLPVVTEVSAPVTLPEVWVGWALPPGVGVEANARQVLTRLLGGLLHVGLEDEGDADSPRLEAAHIALGVSGGQLGSVLSCRARLPAGGDPEREADAIIEHVSSLWLRLNEEQSWFERVRINAMADAALDTSDVVVRALEEARLLETNPRARPGDILQRTSAVSYAEALGWARNFLRKDQARVVVVRPSEGVTAAPAAARARSVLHGAPSSTAMAFVAPGKRVTDVARPMGASQAVTKTLPNGLTVTVMRRPGAALTSLLLGFRAAPDPHDAPAVRAAISSAWQLRYFHRASEAGIEHRMHVNADSISERIEVIAGREAEAIAYLGRAVGAVAIEWPSDRFQRWATMQHTEEDRPVPRARRAFTSALWRGHLYGAQPLVADLEAVESRDLERWLDRVRQPSNGTLIVVGDVDPVDTFRRVEDALGGWKKAAAPANTPPAPPNVPAGGALRVLAQSVSGRGAATLEVGCLLPSARDEKQRTSNSLLARLVNERLRDSLRQLAGASYAPHASAQIYDGGAATLAGSADVDPAELPLALETVRALFDRGAALPFDGAALERVRWAEAREGNLRDRTTRDVARALFVRWALGWPLATLDEAPARLEAATLGDVEAALQTCRASAVVSVVGDPQSLTTAGIRN